MGRWALPKQDMAQVSLCIRQVARLLRSLHDTFAEVVQHDVKGLPGRLRQTYASTTASACSYLTQRTSNDHTSLYRGMIAMQVHQVDSEY